MAVLSRLSAKTSVANEAVVDRRNVLKLIRDMSPDGARELYEEHFVWGQLGDRVRENWPSGLVPLQTMCLNTVITGYSRLPSDEGVLDQVDSLFEAAATAQEDHQGPSTWSYCNDYTVSAYLKCLKQHHSSPAEAVASVVDRMPTLGIEMNEVVLTQFLSVMRDLEALESAMREHERYVTTAARNVYLQKKLEFGRIPDALDFEPDAVTLGTLMSHYLAIARSSPSLKASAKRNILRTYMQANDVDGSVVDMTTLACSWIVNNAGGDVPFVHVGEERDDLGASWTDVDIALDAYESGLPSTSATRNVLATLYHANMPGIASKIFTEHVRSSRRVSPEVYNEMIIGLSRNDRHSQAVRLYNAALTSDKFLPPDSYSHSAVLTSFFNEAKRNPSSLSQMASDAIDVFSAIESPNSVVRNNVIAIVALVDLPKAIEYVKKPNVITYGCLMLGARNFREVLMVQSAVEGVDANIVVMTEAIAAMRRGKDLQSGSSWIYDELRGMLERGAKVNADVVDCVARALCDGGDLDGALDIVLSPDVDVHVKTWTAVVSYCEKFGRVKDSVKVMHRMQENGVEFYGVGVLDEVFKRALTLINKVV